MLCQELAPRCCMTCTYVLPCNHRHGLMVGLDDLTGLSNLSDSVILCSTMDGK